MHKYCTISRKALRNGLSGNITKGKSPSIEIIETYLLWPRSPHPKRSSIITLIDILENYSLFTDCFLATYVDVIRVYFSEESKRLAGVLKDSPGEFLLHCDQRIKEEVQRCNEVLLTFKPCWNDINKTTEKALLEGQLRWLSLGTKSSTSSSSSLT